MCRSALLKLHSHCEYEWEKLVCCLPVVTYRNIICARSEDRISEYLSVVTNPTHSKSQNIRTGNPRCVSHCCGTTFHAFLWAFIQVKNWAIECHLWVAVVIEKLGFSQKCCAHCLTYTESNKLRNRTTERPAESSRKQRLLSSECDVKEEVLLPCPCLDRVRCTWTGT